VLRGIEQHVLAYVLFPQYALGAPHLRLGPYELQRNRTRYFPPFTFDPCRVYVLVEQNCRRLSIF